MYGIDVIIAAPIKFIFKCLFWKPICIQHSKMSGASGVKLGREAEIALVWWWPGRVK